MHAETWSLTHGLFDGRFALSVLPGRYTLVACDTGNSLWREQLDVGAGQTVRAGVVITAFCSTSASSAMRKPVPAGAWCLDDEVVLSVRRRVLLGRRDVGCGGSGKNSDGAGHIGVVLSGEAVQERERRFEALYSDYYSLIYAYVHRRLGGGVAETPDVVAEVFAVVWRRIDDVPDPPEDRLWLYGVAYRSVLRGRRGGLRRARLHDRLAHAATVQYAAAVGSDPAGADVLAAIERLRPQDREVLRLVMWEDLSHAEAARVLGCSANAVAIRLHKVKARLRNELGLAPPPGRFRDLEPGS